MKKRRLLKLADLLEADAKNKRGVKFDLESWGYTKDGTLSASCNTTACAIGLAVVSGAFRRAGLTNGFSSDPTICPKMPSGELGFGAVMELFEIDYSTADWLFSHSSYSFLDQTGARGERAVAKRIRQFVADGRAS